MHAVHAIPDLEKALDDVEPTVVLAAANSLMTLKDSNSAYDIYYGVLTGGMRTNRGFVQEQLKTLHDSKKLAELGFQEGIGFVPFGGVSYGVVKIGDEVRSVRDPGGSSEENWRTIRIR